MKWSSDVNKDFSPRTIEDQDLGAKDQDKELHSQWPGFKYKYQDKDLSKCGQITSLLVICIFSD